MSVRPDYQFCGMQQFVLYIGANLKAYRCCYTAYTAHGEVGSLADKTLAEWFASVQKKQAYENFDARSCDNCALNGNNKIINYLAGETPVHVNFV